MENIPEIFDLLANNNFAETLRAGITNMLMLVFHNLKNRKINFTINIRLGYQLWKIWQSLEMLRKFGF